MEREFANLFLFVIMKNARTVISANKITGRAVSTDFFLLADVLVRSPRRLFIVTV